MKRLLLGSLAFALAACASSPATAPVAYCRLAFFLTMKPETAQWIAHNDAAFGRQVRDHNATHLRECK